jgi:hypothetical protein
MSGWRTAVARTVKRPAGSGGACEMGETPGGGETARRLGGHGEAGGGEAPDRERPVLRPRIGFRAPAVARGADGRERVPVRGAGCGARNEPVDRRIRADLRRRALRR